MAAALASLFAGCTFDGAPSSSSESDAPPANGGADAGDLEADAAPTATCTPLPVGALAWWDGEILGVDRLGAFPTGTFFESPSVEPGLVGNAMLLEEDEDIIFDPAPVSAQFTVEGWIRRDKDDVDYMTVYGNGDEAGLFLQNHRLVYYDELAGGNALVGNTTLSIATYYHIAVTYDGVTLTLYLDGTKDSATTGAAVSLPVVGRVGGVLFGVGDGDGNDFVGHVDELTVYARALLNTEIADIAAAGALGKCK